MAKPRLDPSHPPRIYTFRPNNVGLLFEGHLLAAAYGTDLNTVLAHLLENAIEEWAIPTYEIKSRPEWVDEIMVKFHAEQKAKEADGGERQKDDNVLDSK